MSKFVRPSTFRMALLCVAAAALVISGRAAAKYQQPLSIELKAAVWTGDLDVLAEHRAIRVLVPAIASFPCW